MTPVSLRSERPEDHEFLRALYASTREAEMAILPWPPDQIAAFLDMQFEAQTSHYAAVFTAAERSIIELEERPVGRLYLDHREDEIRVIDIALMPTARGRGIGGNLLRGVLAAAAQRGVAVRIHVEVNNPARSLYDRLGFREIETRGIYTLMEWRPEVATPTL